MPSADVPTDHLRAYGRLARRSPGQPLVAVAAAPDGDEAQLLQHPHRGGVARLHLGDQAADPGAALELHAHSTDRLGGQALPAGGTRP